MKAVAFARPGGPEVLEFVEVPRPKPQPGEATIKVKIAGINHLDIWVREDPGRDIPMPHILGADAVGTIAEIRGPGHGFRAGDNVLTVPGLACRMCQYCSRGQDSLCSDFQILGYQRQGTYAEYVNVPVANLVKRPRGLNDEDWASLPLVLTTAYHIVFTLLDTQPGDMILITGAGSGVSSIAIQLAARAGASVFTTSSFQPKRERALELGASQALDHSSPRWVDALMEATGGRGVRLVLDHVGGEVASKALGTLSKGGTIVMCGATTGAEMHLDIATMYRRQLTLVGSYMGSKWELMNGLDLVERGLIKPIVDRVFPLCEATTAHRHIESRSNFGKVLLRV